MGHFARSQTRQQAWLNCLSQRIKKRQKGGNCHPGHQCILLMRGQEAKRAMLSGQVTQPLGQATTFLAQEA